MEPYWRLIIIIYKIVLLIKGKYSQFSEKINFIANLNYFFSKL